MAELIGPAPAEADGTRKVAGISRRQHIGRVGRRQTSERETFLQIECVDARAELVELLGHLVLLKPKLLRALGQSCQRGTRRRVTNGVDLMSELRETTDEFPSRAFG